MDLRLTGSPDLRSKPGIRVSACATKHIDLQFNYFEIVILKEHAGTGKGKNRFVPMSSRLRMILIDGSSEISIGLSGIYPPFEQCSKLGTWLSPYAYWSNDGQAVLCSKFEDRRGYRVGAPSLLIRISMGNRDCIIVRPSILRRRCNRLRLACRPRRYLLY